VTKDAENTEILTQTNGIATWLRGGGRGGYSEVSGLRCCEARGTESGDGAARRLRVHSST
jgi:hypothetical protein